jgi:hypothetical protein
MQGRSASQGGGRQACLGGGWVDGGAHRRRRPQQRLKLARRRRGVAAQQRARGEVAQRELGHCARGGGASSGRGTVQVKPPRTKGCAANKKHRSRRARPAVPSTRPQHHHSPQAGPSSPPRAPHSPPNNNKKKEHPGSRPPVQLASSIISSTIWLASRTCAQPAVGAPDGQKANPHAHGEARKAHETHTHIRTNTEAHQAHEYKQHPHISAADPAQTTQT